MFTRVVRRAFRAASAQAEAFMASSAKAGAFKDWNQFVVPITAAAIGGTALMTSKPSHMWSWPFGGKQEVKRNMARIYLAGTKNKTEAPEIVMGIFAGRRNITGLTVRYGKKLLEEGLIDELHVWDFTGNDDDQAWVAPESLRREYFKAVLGLKDQWVVELVSVERTSPRMGFPKWLEFYDYYAKPGTLAPNGVLVKADDDIVFIDVDKFKGYSDFCRNHASEVTFVSANVVNNAVCAHHQYARQCFAAVKSYQGEYPQNDGKDHGDELFDHDIMAAIHKAFCANRLKFSWETDGGLPIIHPDESLSRISIMFVAICNHENRIAKIADLVLRRKPQDMKIKGQEPGTDDEAALTWDTQQEGMPPGRIYTPLNVVKLARSKQLPFEDQLAMYKNLADESSV